VGVHVSRSKSGEKETETKKKKSILPVNHAKQPGCAGQCGRQGMATMSHEEQGKERKDEYIYDGKLAKRNAWVQPVGPQPSAAL